ncbi:FHIPEP family type III secretion protein, partial [Streptococcus pneumoniae]|nr:FHIPEP family type III secretion protein [Streptococcus pneumoniae]
SSESVIQSVAREIEQLSLRQETPVLLCSPPIRMYVKQLLERYFPDLPVLSYNELEANVEVQSIGVVDI